MTKGDVFRAVSDLIAESYEWLADEENKDKAIQYVLGLNDMARYLAEKCPDKPAPQQEKRPKKIDIDMGKVKALRKAGRTVDWIADDMGVSPATIYSRLKEEGEKDETD